MPWPAGWNASSDYGTQSVRRRAVTPSGSAWTPATLTPAVRNWSGWSIGSKPSPGGLTWCANDARDAFDSGADRHANFGEGEVGTEALAEVVRTAAVPVVVETPGGREGQGSDIAWLKENV